MVNIFAVDSDPVAAAQALYDKHVVKMPIESLQMLSAIHRVCDGTECEVDSVYFAWKDTSKVYKKPRKFMMLPSFGESVMEVRGDSGVSSRKRVVAQVYLMAHRNHPCTLWARETTTNYEWLSKHTEALFAEYTYRYGKHHTSFKVYDQFLRNPPSNIPHGDLTPFALAMKSYPQCVVEGNPIQSYINYYNLKPSLLKHPMCWKNRVPPIWFEGNNK